MALNATAGPNLTFGLTGTSTNGLTYSSLQDYNDQRAPDVSDLGFAMADPRAAYAYNPGEPVTTQTMCFYNSRGSHDFVAVAASSVGLVAANTASTGTGVSGAFTLQSASTGRGTYSVNITAPENGAAVTSILTCDSSVSQFLSFGVSGTVAAWAPGTGAGRCISIVTTSGSDSPYTVVGRDIYGYKMTEQIPIGAALSITASYGGIGIKAFKYVSAIYNSSVPTSTGLLGIGFCDRLGLPMYGPYGGQNIAISVSSGANLGNLIIGLTSANYALPMASTGTATSTTADTRGVWISSVTLTTNYRVQINVTPSASAAYSVSASDVTGLFGATQYSSV